MNSEFFTDSFEKEIRNLRHSFKENSDSFELNINGQMVHFNKVDSQFIVAPNEWISSKHADNKVHEPGLIAALSLLSKMINHKVVFYDVGALFSYHSIIANALFSEIRCVTVEGNPYSARCINELTAPFENFTNVNAVMGLENKRESYSINGFLFVKSGSFEAFKLWLEFEIFEKNALRRLLNLFGKSYKILGHVKKVELETIAIPHLFAFNPDNAPEIFKFDTEGFQSVFLPPYVQTLCKRNAIILLELDNPEQMKKFGVTNNDIVQQFLAEGYKVFWLDHRTRRGVKEVNAIEGEMDRNSLVMMMPQAFLSEQPVAG